MKNVIDFIKWGLSHVKRNTVPVGARLPVPHSFVGSGGEWEYLYGTTGNRVTQSMLDYRYRKSYKGWGWTKSKFDNTTKNWAKNRKMVCDCQGVEDCYSRSQTNANGNYLRYCTDKGLCAAINRPYVLGEAVFNGSSRKKSHVGWICGFMPNGDPLVMEERGLAYGFVITKMSKRKWKYRGLMKKRYSYQGAEPKPITKPTSYVFTRVLKYGRRGNDVKELKKVLKEHGFGGLTLTNGNFYSKTRRVVMAFQKHEGLTEDGKAGPRTYRALGVKYDL